MSLDFQLTKIRNWEELVLRDDNGRPAPWKPKEDTTRIIFGCISTGIGNITEKNHKEWYARYSVWCKIKGFTPPPLSLVVRHIGLTTNVFPEEKRSAWMKRIVVRELDDLLRVTDLTGALGKIDRVKQEAQS